MKQKGWLLDIKGKSGSTYSFEVEIDPQYIQEWKGEGINIVGRLENTIPMWVVDIGLTRPWCFFQSLFNFRNPF